MTKDHVARPYGPLTPVPVISTRDHVYRVLRQALISGRIPAGSRIMELDLAAQLQVSRTPVREALRRLESDGLVQSRPHRHIIATPPTTEDLADLHLLRVEVDKLVARLACTRAKPQDWDQVRMLITEMGKVLESHELGSPEYVIAHSNVHIAINRAAFSVRTAARVQYGLLPFMDASADLVYIQQEGYEPVVQHVHLVDALASGDEARAVGAAVDHATRGPNPVTGLVSATTHERNGSLNTSH